MNIYWKSISNYVFVLESLCSRKGLMKIKSRFNWYCSLNEPFGWITWTSTRDRGEWRRVASMNCVRNELMNVILVWLPWLLNSYSQNHRLSERSVCEYTCAQRFASITISIHMYIVFPNHSHCNYLIWQKIITALNSGYAIYIKHTGIGAEKRVRNFLQH